MDAKTSKWKFDRQRYIYIILKYFLTRYLLIAKRKGVTLNRENQIIKEWDKSRCSPLNGMQWEYSLNSVYFCQNEEYSGLEPSNVKVVQVKERLERIQNALGIEEDYWDVTTNAAHGPGLEGSALQDTSGPLVRLEWDP